MGPTPNKMHKKGSHFIKKIRCWKVFQFPETYCFVEVIFQNRLCRRPFNQKLLVFRKNPRTHLEVQGSFGDEWTFQEYQKSWIIKIPLVGETENWRPGVHFDAEYLSAPFCRVKTPWIAILSKIFCFLQKIQFFNFSAYWTPIGILLDPYWT